jgi:hypothetical protein
VNARDAETPDAFGIGSFFDIVHRIMRSEV